MALELGQKAKFIEHAATIVDIDSGGDTALTDGVMWREGTEDVEVKTNRVIQRRHEWIFGGNALETEYCGETGRTAMGEVIARERDGKLVWKMTEELTPRTMDFEEMSKMG